MPRVSYTAPATVDEAVKALASAAGLTKVLSGGTDLLVQLKSGRVKPDLIVDMKHIPGLIGIREEGGFSPRDIHHADPHLLLAHEREVDARGRHLCGSHARDDGRRTQPVCSS